MLHYVHWLVPYFACVPFGAERTSVECLTRILAANCKLLQLENIHENKYLDQIKTLKHFITAAQLQSWVIILSGFEL